MLKNAERARKTLIFYDLSRKNAADNNRYRLILTLFAPAKCTFFLEKSITDTDKSEFSQISDIK